MTAPTTDVRNSEDGALFSPQPESIEVYPSGDFVDLLNPQPETIHPQDVCHHLSMICRYTGGVARFYSVAEHCAFVHDLIPYCVDPGKFPIHCVDLQRAALLHDAPEAYLTDVSAPAKYALRVVGATYDGAFPSKPVLPRDSEYDMLERRMSRAIAERFEIDHDLFFDPVLKLADLWAMRLEAAKLTKSGGSNWRWPGELPNGGELPKDIDFVGGMRNEYAMARLRARMFNFWGSEF